MQLDQLKRREFITLLGSAAATSMACPLAAYAQQPVKVSTIGFLGTGTPSTWSPWVLPFVQRMHELGWIEGRTVAIEYRWAEGRSERYAEFAAEFVRLKVDVIVTTGPAVLTVMQATSVIPIVFPVAVDPVSIGLVASLARPGGNVTGLSVQSTETVGKRVELLRAIVPGLQTLGIMANLDYPASVIEVGEVEAVARNIGLHTIVTVVRHADDIPPAFEALKGQAGALFVCTDAVMTTNRVRIITSAHATQLPTMFGFQEFVESGGLMSYGANYPSLFRRAGDYVDKILHGVNPADIPVEQPTKFDFVINLTTAKALGLAVPPSLIARADQVIE